MDRFCIFCGAPLVGDEPCPCISKYARTAPQTVSALKKGEVPQVSDAPTDGTEFLEWGTGEEQEAPKLSSQEEQETAVSEEEPDTELEYEPELQPLHYRPLRDSKASREETVEGYVATVEERGKVSSFLSVLKNIPSFLGEYCVNFLPYGRELARAGDLRYGLAFMLISLILSAASTLVYGIFHLEEFFLRWYVAGIMTPIIGFAVSFGYVLSVMGRARNTASARSIMVTVGLSTVFPSVLQFCSLILSPLDGSGKVFQFFALLILLTWLFSLFSTTFSVYRVKIGLGTLLLSVAFSFLAIVMIRAVWIWFLTGFANFAFYLPSSLYPGELYEAFIS